MFAEIVKEFLIPGSITFLLLAVSACVALLYAGRRGATVGRRGLVLLLLLYLVLSIPVVANGLIAGLEPDVPPLHSREAARGARVVAVIGNGAVSYAASSGVVHQFARRTAFAVLEGARLYRLLEPEWVIVSGGIPNPNSQQEPESVIMRDELVRQGVPVERIVLESESTNTSQQLRNIARLVRARQLPEPIVVVTTPAHAARVQLFAAAEDLQVVLSSADELRYDSTDTRRWRNWFPSAGALQGSASAMYEYLALVYGWSGWQALPD